MLVLLCLFLQQLTHTVGQSTSPIAVDKLGVLYPRDNADLSRIAAEKTLVVVEYYRPHKMESVRLRKVIDSLARIVGPAAGMIPFARITVPVEADTAALPWMSVVHRGRVAATYTSDIFREEVLLRFLAVTLQQVDMPLDEQELLERGVRLMDEGEFLALARAEKERMRAVTGKKKRKQFAAEKFGFEWQEGLDNHEIRDEEKDAHFVDGMSAENDGSVPSDDWWRDNLEGLRDDEDIYFDEDEDHQNTYSTENADPVQRNLEEDEVDL